MRGRVVVTPPEEFDTWLAATADLRRRRRRSRRRILPPAPASTRSARPATAPRARAIRRSTRRGSRARRPGTCAASCTRSGTDVRGAHERDTYGAQMRAFASMLPDDTSIRNLSAYVESLPGQAPQATRHRQRRARPAPVHHLRFLPRREGRGNLGAQRAAPRRHVGLVPRPAAAELPARRARRASPGLLRLADGDLRRLAQGRALDQRRRRLHQHARSMRPLAPRCGTGGRTDGIRRNRGPGRAGPRSAYLLSQVHLEPGPQGHRDPVRDRRDLRRADRAGAVGD